MARAALGGGGRGNPAAGGGNGRGHNGSVAGWPHGAAGEGVVAPLATAGPAASEVLPAGSRAVLVGVSAYEYAGLPPARAARASLDTMHALLADPALGGWPPEWITVIANPLSAAALAAHITGLAGMTQGVLLLY